MANICTFSVAFYGELNSIRKLRNKYYSIETDNDFEVPLANLLSEEYDGDARAWGNTTKEGFLIPPQEIKNHEPDMIQIYQPHGTLIKSLECVPSEYSEAFFIIDGNGAWSEKPALLRAIAEEFGVDFDVYAEEQGCTYFVNTDADGTFFTDRYIYIPDDYAPNQISNNTLYFDSIEELLFFLEDNDISIYIENCHSEEDVKSLVRKVFSTNALGWLFEFSDSSGYPDAHLIRN